MYFLRYCAQSITKQFSCIPLIYTNLRSVRKKCWNTLALDIASAQCNPSFSLKVLQATDHIAVRAEPSSSCKIPMLSSKTRFASSTISSFCAGVRSNWFNLNTSLWYNLSYHLYLQTCKTPLLSLPSCENRFRETFSFKVFGHISLDCSTNLRRKTHGQIQTTQTTRRHSWHHFTTEQISEVSPYLVHTEGKHIKWQHAARFGGSQQRDKGQVITFALLAQLFLAR